MKNQTLIPICDIWFSIRNKHGWLADCLESGYSKEQLDEMERLEDDYTWYKGEDIPHIERFDIYEKGQKVISDYQRIKKEKYPHLDTRLKDWEIEQAKNFPLHRLLGKKFGERIPCPFHNGKDKNFMISNFGYCFVCHKHCNSLNWQMDICGLKFRDAVKSLK
jgi:hypothetical protein